MGRYINGDINLKLWFAVQDSNAADRFGVTGHQPQELYYYFDKEDLPGIQEGLKIIEEFLGANLVKLHKFFEKHTAYTDEKLAEYLNVDLSVTKQLLSEYADYELGLKILKAVQTDGQCEFTAEL